MPVVTYAPKAGKSWTGRHSGCTRGCPPWRYHRWI